MDDAIAAVRSFNRFYTRLVGALDDHFLGSDLTLPEARLLFEIVNGERPLASDLTRTLGMDAGFVSRVLRRFEERGWITRGAEEDDGRRRPIAPTEEGRAVYRLIDQRQRAAVEGMLRLLAPAQQRDLTESLGAARALLGGAEPGFVIRPFRTGDLGRTAARQAILYREEYGWGRGIEVNIAEATAAFLGNFKEGRDQGWIAEVAGALAGQVLVTDEGEGLARLRLLYVEPMARGRGVGDALVTTCIAFAREKSYGAMTLWTHSVLVSARRIYAAHGFELIETAWHDEFGLPLQGEIWRLELANRRD
jgi:DNA-binding MarR family transcriptional regulator/ribosomal protein S18 acetylase RimI-like enzyme